MQGACCTHFRHCDNRLYSLIWRLTYTHAGQSDAITQPGAAAVRAAIGSLPLDFCLLQTYYREAGQDLPFSGLAVEMIVAFTNYDTRELKDSGLISPPMRPVKKCPKIFFPPDGSPRQNNLTPFCPSILALQARGQPTYALEWNPEFQAGV